jgi:CshA-type fibril repeat protein
MPVLQRRGSHPPRSARPSKTAASQTAASPHRRWLIGLTGLVVAGLGVLALTTPAQATAIPGTPGKPTAVAGDSRVTITISPPTSGGTVTGYIVRVTDDNNNRCLLTAAQTTCVIPDLSNGTAYTFESLATGTGDSSYWSVPSNSVTPRAAGSSTPTPTPTTNPLVPAPTRLWLTAGTASLTATWSAVSGTVGYTATTHPGSATCLTTGLSCVLGAVAGTPTTVTVVAHTAAGDSADSTASAAVLPRSPAIPATLPTSATAELSTEDGLIGLATQGQPIILVGTGFAPYSSTVVALYSTPVRLGSATVDAAGAFSIRVLVPDALASGSHTLLASGVDPDGDARMITLPITVAATEAGSSGKDSVPQTGRLPIPTGGAVTLLDENDAPTRQVEVAGGSYSLNRSTGVVTFDPADWFTGIAPAIQYRISDALGTLVTGTYTARVTTVPAAGAPKLALPDRIVATIESPAAAPVTCSIARGAIARCIVTGTAMVSSEKVVIGYGVTTPSLTQDLRRVGVTVVLNERGRFLTARPGGVRMTFAAELIQRDYPGSRHTSASTTVEAQTYRLSRSVKFRHNSGSISGSETKSLKTANAKLSDGVGITCAGHADRLENDPAALAARRARAACRVIAKALHATTRTTATIDEHPSGDDNTPAGRAHNRRVTITIEN